MGCNPAWSSDSWKQAQTVYHVYKINVCCVLCTSVLKLFAYVSQRSDLFKESEKKNPVILKGVNWKIRFI